MDRVEFIHISDVHYSSVYDSLAAKLIDRTGRDFTHQFRDGMDFIRRGFAKPAFFLLSGDLVHEGTAEEYRSLRGIWEEIWGDTPLYASPGNHDSSAYGPGFLNTDKPSKLDFEYLVPGSGLRIISMDSRGGAYESGRLEDYQLEWLADRLPAGSGKNTLLMLHHTPHVSGEVEFLSFQMENPGALYEVVRGSGLLAIFCGHTHKPYVSALGDIPCYTVGSITHEIDCGVDAMTLSNRTCFNHCVYENGKLTVRGVGIPPGRGAEYVMPYSEF